MGKSGTKLIQLQRDWFLHNWREVSGDERYPHFEGTRDEFLRRWREFSAFCKDNSLGAPQASLGEVTYVNHIVKGTCWDDFGDLSRVFTFLSELKDDRLRQSLDSLSLSQSFKLPLQDSHLYVTIVPAIRSRDKQLVIRMNLTVRGRLGTGQGSDFVEWFNAARWWIVKGFELLTTKKAHDFWRRIA
jgi:uncharacterized protein (TIGR04255 family)